MATPDGYSGWLLRMATPDGYSGWLLRMATPDGYSGWLLRMATPDGYSGWLLRMATLATGVLGTIPKGQPGLGETTYITSCLPSVTIVSLHVGLDWGPQCGGNGVVLPVHRYRMFRLSGGSRDVFPTIDGGAGAGHE